MLEKNEQVLGPIVWEVEEYYEEFRWKVGLATYIA